MLLRFTAPAQEDSFISSLVARYLPDHMKRLIFVTTAYGVLLTPPPPDPNDLGRLNTVMKLAHRPKALWFPFYFANWIWRHRVGVVVLADGQRMTLDRLFHTPELRQECEQPQFSRALATQLVRVMPEWLEYASRSVMTKDLECLIRTVVMTEA
jgi:hypothetical protein